MRNENCDSATRPGKLAMSVTYEIRFEVIPEKVDMFLDLLTDVLDAMRHEPMFHDAMLHSDPESDHHFMLYETWESHDDVVAVQLNRPYRQEWHRALPGLLAADRDITVWSRLRADRKSELPASS